MIHEGCAAYPSYLSQYCCSIASGWLLIKGDHYVEVVSVPDTTNPSMDHFSFSIACVTLEAIHALDKWSGNETIM